MKKNRKRVPMFMRVEHHIRRKLVSGLLLLLPLGISILVLRFLFGITAGYLLPIAGKLLGPQPVWVMLGSVVVVFLLFIYVVGLVTSLVVGRKLVEVGEYIIMKVPVLKTIYGASKQVVGTFSATGQESFRSVALCEFPRRGLRSVAFITGTIVDETGRTCYKLFVPTAPNPTTGFLVILPRTDVVHTSLTVEEGIKMIVSVGIIAPDRLVQAPVLADVEGAAGAAVEDVESESVS